MKNLLTGITILATTSLCSAQVLVHDGFESYTKDIPLSINGNNWGHYGYDFDTMSTGFIRGEYQGIKPYEGNQMYGIATGLELNAGRAIAESRSSSPVEPPASEVSVAFFVGAENMRCHNLEFAGQRGGSPDIRTTINLSTGDWSLRDDDFRVRTGSATVRAGAWNVVKHRYDWAQNQITVYLNGVTLTTGFAYHSLFGGNRLTGGFIAVSNRVTAGSQYSYPIGGPPLFVDDYRLTNVPEPSSITIAFGLLAVGAIWRLRRGLHS